MWIVLAIIYLLIYYLQYTMHKLHNCSYSNAPDEYYGRSCKFTCFSVRVSENQLTILHEPYILDIGFHKENH